MASTTITIPSFNFAAFYYPQILESLILFKREYAEELTDESEFEPTIQMLRAFACVGHLNNVLADVIANESTLPTAKLPETVRNMLRLIDYEMRPATPASVDIVFKLSRVFSTTIEVIPIRAQFATRRRGGTSETIYFEALTALSVDRTDQLGAVYKTDDDVAFSDITASMNAGTPEALTLVTGSKIYFGHSSAMYDRIDLIVDSAASAAIDTGVWEYYDGDVRDADPDSVVNVGGGVLRFYLNDLLGTQKRTGAEVTVQLNSTTSSEVVASLWDGSNNYVETGLLGQSSPSTTAGDYTVGVEWKETTNVSDGTIDLSTTGENSITYSLPQTETEDWEKATVDSFEGYFLRYRVVETTSSAVTISRARIDRANLYTLANAVQGRSVVAEVLGSSNGEANQEFPSSQEVFILNTNVVRVDAVEWTEVDNFLASLSQDKHYVIELGEDDVASVVFGDGVQGKIPDVGQGNVEMDYRFGADDDGNVGANTVTVDKTGVTYISSLFNPRAATGWAEAQSASEASLEKAKIEGPASLRIREVAIGPDDLEELATSYTDDSGSSPFSRAYAIEEGFGPKTIEVVLVARGGGQASSTQLEDFEKYINGDSATNQPKRIVSNQEAIASNFTAVPVDVEATVYAPSDVTAAQVRNRLAGILQPEALEDDGVTFIWKFGDEVPRSRIIHEIFETDSKIEKVDLTTPAADIVLDRRELPTNGTFTITMVRTD